jgi:excisionase family DNA binding protein
LPRRDLEPLIALLTRDAEPAPPPPEPASQPLLLTRAQVAEQLGLSPASVQRLLSNGQLRSVSIGRARRIRYRDLQQFVDDLARGVDTVAFDRGGR